MKITTGVKFQVFKQLPNCSVVLFSLHVTNNGMGKEIYVLILPSLFSILRIP